ncbi:MAG: hypothetical protein M3N17_05380 [Actinomycetota bacterium]|nr:hypothetical protein [Actinomycetota bacterium]
MPSQHNTLARSLNDLGLAAWFGGSLMGAVGLNGATQEVSDARERTRVSNAGWGRWQPLNAVAVGAYLAGSAQLLRANRGRLVAQRGVGTLSGLKTLLTVAAVGTTAYSGYMGRRLEAHEQTGPSGGVPASGTTEPTPQTPPEAAEAQRRLRALQWAIPALTGALLVVDARLSEQQRPGQVVRGVLERLNRGD